MLDQVSTICQTRCCQLVYTYTDTYTSGHRDREIRAWSVSADARRPTLAGYSSVSAVQACCDSPSLSLPPSSMLPRRLLCTSLRSSWSPASAICQMSSTASSFREFAAALLGPAHFLSPEQQFKIHCLIICAYLHYDVIMCDPAVDSEHVSSIEDVSVRRTCGNVSAKEVSRNRALQIDIYLLTYWLIYLLTYLLAYITNIHIHTHEDMCAWRRRLGLFGNLRQRITNKQISQCIP